MIGIGDFTADTRETQWSCDEVKRTSCMGIADSDRQAGGVTPLCKGHSRMRILRSFGVKMKVRYMKRRYYGFNGTRNETGRLNNALQHRRAYPVRYW